MSPKNRSGRKDDSIGGRRAVKQGYNRAIIWAMRSSPMPHQKTQGWIESGVGYRKLVNNSWETFSQ
jgi:hypothetical protein